MARVRAAAARDGVLVELERGETRRYRSLLHRPDGLVVAFEGGSYNRIGGGRDLPHDLAHLIVEDELDLRLGVWGVLAAGGMFAHATVVEGRRAPHATRRGREVIAAAGDRIMQAEVLVRAVCDAVAEGAADASAVRRGVGERWDSDALTDAALERAAARLRAGSEAWAALKPGGRLRETWRRPVARL